MRAGQRIKTHNLARLIHPIGTRAERAGEVQRAEIAVDQRETMDAVPVGVETGDFPVRRDAERGCYLSARKVDYGEAVAAQQETVDISRANHVVADDLSSVADPSSHRLRGAGKVDSSEIARAQQKAVL